MNKTLVIALILTFVAAMAWAGGDKVHGDKGQGKVVQVVGP